MTAVIVSAAFDYSSVAPDHVGGLMDDAAHLRGMIGALHQQMQEAQRRVTVDAAAIGADLVHVKDRLPHGAFGAWCKAELGIEPRTAQHYMNAARLLAGVAEPIRETVSLLPPATVYALGAPNLPDDVRGDLLGKVAAGERIRVADVQRAAKASYQPSAEDKARAEQRRQDQRRRDAARQQKEQRERAAADAEAQQQRADLRRVLTALFAGADPAAIQAAVDVLAGPHRAGNRWRAAEILIEILMEKNTMQQMDVAA